MYDKYFCTVYYCNNQPLGGAFAAILDCDKFSEIDIALALYIRICPKVASLEQQETEVYHKICVQLFKFLDKLLEEDLQFRDTEYSPSRIILTMIEVMSQHEIARDDWAVIDRIIRYGMNVQTATACRHASIELSLPHLMNMTSMLGSNRAALLKTYLAATKAASAPPPAGGISGIVSKKPGASGKTPSKKTSRNPSTETLNEFDSPGYYWLDMSLFDKKRIKIFEPTMDLKKLHYHVLPRTAPSKTYGMRIMNPGEYLRLMDPEPKMSKDYAQALMATGNKAWDEFWKLYAPELLTYATCRPTHITLPIEKWNDYYKDTMSIEMKKIATSVRETCLSHNKEILDNLEKMPWTKKR